MDSWVNTRSQMPWLPHWSAPLVAQDALGELQDGLHALGFRLLLLGREDAPGEVGFLRGCSALLGLPAEWLTWDNFVEAFVVMLSRRPEPVAFLWSRADRVLEADLHAFLKGVYLFKEVQYRMAVRKSMGIDAAQFAFYLLGEGSQFDARPRERRT